MKSFGLSLLCCVVGALAVVHGQFCNIPAQGAPFNWNAVPQGTYSFKLQSYLVRRPLVNSPQSPIATGPPQSLTFYHVPGVAWISVYSQTQFVFANGSYVYNPATSTKPASCEVRDGSNGTDLWTIQDEYDGWGRTQFFEADGQGVAAHVGEFAMPEPMFLNCPYRLRWFGLGRDVGAGHQDMAILLYTDPFNGRVTKISFSQYYWEGAWVLVSGTYTASEFDPNLPAGYNQLPSICTSAARVPYNPSSAPDAVLAAGSPPIPATQLAFVH